MFIIINKSITVFASPLTVRLLRRVYSSIYLKHLTNSGTEGFSVLYGRNRRIASMAWIPNHVCQSQEIIIIITTTTITITIIIIITITIIMKL